MNHKKQKTITHVGMWLAAIVGSICGLFYVIGGYLLDWGPGGGMEGPLWRVLITGIVSALIGAYVGELLVRKLSRKMLSNRTSLLNISGLSFVVALIACTIAFYVGLLVVLMMGILTGSIENLEWNELGGAPLLGLIFSIPFGLGSAILFSGYVFVYLKVNNKERVTE
jgi:uncharacterized membrane protein YoaK (UPF0700 family)